LKNKFFAILGSIVLTSSLLGSNASAQTTFKDVNNYWASAQINYLAENNIIGGYPDGTFKPNNQLTRVQAAKMLIKALKLSTSNRPAPQFKDIPTGHQEFNAIATIADEGLMGGTNGYFRPNETLTRAQMSAILVKAFDLTEGSTYTEFKDVTKKHWAYENILLIASNRITGGYSDGTFRPSQPTTRAQFSVFLAITLYPELFQPEDFQKVTRKANYIKSYGGWLYYINSNENGDGNTSALYREKLDGSQKVKLTLDEEDLQNFEIENGEIYFKTSNDFQKMSINGQNKQSINLPLNPHRYEVEGEWVYYLAYDSNICGPSREGEQLSENSWIEGPPFNVYRTNLKTMQTSLLKKKCEHQTSFSGAVPLGTVSEKGIYLPEFDEFYQTNSTQPQKVDLSIGGIFVDRGNLFYTEINSKTGKTDFIQYNEQSRKTKLIKEIPKMYGEDLRLRNIYNGHAYFTAEFNIGTKVKLYRMPLSGGNLETIADLPTGTSSTFSLMGGKILYYDRNNSSIIKRVPLPN
jgi:hypothetical protein